MAKKLYQAQIIDEDTGDTLTSIFSYSQEGLEEEMGKSKWNDFVGETTKGAPLEEDPEEEDEEHEVLRRNEKE